MNKCVLNPKIPTKYINLTIQLINCMSVILSHYNKSANTRIIKSSSQRTAGFINKPDKFWTHKETIRKIRSKLSNQNAPMAALAQIIVSVLNSSVLKNESQSSWGKGKDGFNFGQQEDIGQSIIKTLDTKQSGITIMILSKSFQMAESQYMSIKLKK